ncbi:MAG TPA: outer membrane beta-barrel protein [Terriglobales bacterium]|nr:outer membrane beta-barrel protein [Terriglobales bacterium]
MRKVAIMVVCLLVITGAAQAQKNDIALTAGGYFSASNPLDLGVAPALEGTFAHRIASVPLLGLYAEIPVAGSFSSDIPTLSGLTVARSYTSLFITPGLRVRLAPSFPLSPYVSAGLGYARFNRQLFNGTSSANSTFAFDIGGGLDLKFLPLIGLRAEVRDFNSGGLGLETLALGRQNNVFVTAGITLRF